MARNDAGSTSRRAPSRGATPDRPTGAAREQTRGRGDLAPRQRSETASRRPADVPSRAGGEQSVDFWPGEYWTPEIEMFRRGDELVVRADLPGLKPDEVTVEATDDTLAIHGERRRECEESDAGYYRSERSYGSFHRRISLPRGVDPDRMEAQFKDGVLEVTMPAGAAKERERGRRVDLKGG
jgi:HSP20 family protein